MNRTALRSAVRWTLCLLLTLFSVGGAAAQQQGSVTGRVTDNTGAPMAGAQVSIENTQLGALTNEEGRFLILRVPVGQQVVRVTRLGFGSVTQTVAVAAGATVAAEFQLRIEAIELEGIVAVGYGTQKKVNVTGSVAAAPMTEVVQKLPVQSLAVALQGVAPGLQVVDGGHQPGREQVNMMIRGRTTIGGGGVESGRSAPLILIDGVEGTINTIDMDDVESVSVLKDAASAAIYGSRAANGVILVTTKRGQARDKVQITYNGYYGIQDITQFPMQVSTADHMRLTNVAYANACAANPTCDPTKQGVGGGFKYSQDYIQKTLSGEDPLRYPSTDWIDEFYDPAPIQDHTMRVSGGSESARYAISVNYMKEDGMMPTTAADRYSARLNTDFVASDRLTAGFDLAASKRWDIVPYMNWDATFYLTHDTPPTAPARYPSDNVQTAYGWSDTNRNPLVYAEQSGDVQRNFYQGTATARANYDLIPGWVQLQTLGSIRFDYSKTNEFRTAMTFYDYWATQNAGGVLTTRKGSWSPNRIRENRGDGMQNTLRALLDYGHTFNDAHEISGVLGVEQITDNGTSMAAGRDNAYNNALRQMSMGNADTDSNSGSENEWALQSAYGRFNYNFRGRYLLEANARYDGSSRFAPDNRWGFFPSFSAGWRISEEPFFNVPWVNELKLRGSWGELGNQTVGLYSYYSSISLSNPYYFNNALATGAAKTAIQNPNISWETTTATDIGVDAAFLGNRLTLTADWYKRTTDDILLSLPIPGLIGMSAPTQNAGVVENTGWELALGWKDTRGDFNYGIDFNLSDNQNEVVDLVGTGPYISGEYVTMEGEPINSWYGYRALGLFQSQAEVDAHAKQNTPFSHAGDIKWEDISGPDGVPDGQINSFDRTIIGDPNPHYQFGINLMAGWKNFDASIFAQGVGARDQYVALGLAEGPVWENHISKWHLDYWTPDNPDARMPAYYLYQNYNTGQVNSWWILDAKYIKLRNVQLGYTLPQSLLDRVGVERLRLYVSGKNLLTVSNMGIDLDPEFPWVRADYYPQTKVFSIGTDITF